jgi:uncharacterized membrane protein
MNSQTVSTKTGVAYAVVLLFNGLTACLFFSISLKFRISCTPKTIAFSILYAAIVAGTLLTNLKLLQMSTVSNVRLLGAAASMMLTSMLGWLLFQEKFYFKDLFRVFLMLCTSILVFLNVKAQSKQNAKGEQNANAESAEKKEKKKRSELCLFFILVLVSISLGCASTLTVKSYTKATGVSDNNSWFFWTNVFLVLGNSVAVFVLKTKEKMKMKEIVTGFSLKEVFFMVGNTVCSNIGSLLSVAILAKMAVSTYSPISSAIAVLNNVAVSLSFKEKQGKYTWIAVAIALVAIFM